MRARRDVVAGHVAVSVHPLIDAESGVAVELLDLVFLLIEGCLLSKGEGRFVNSLVEENSLEVRVRICRTWLLSLACAGMADRCEAAFIGAKALRFLLYTQSENMAAPLHQGEISRVHLQHQWNKGGGNAGQVPIQLPVRASACTEKGSKGMMARQKPTVVCHVRLMGYGY